MKKITLCIIGIAFMSIFFFTSCVNNELNSITNNDNICQSLGHQWSEATCEYAKECTVCNKTEGEALGHQWSKATCMEYEKCMECGYVENKKLAEHQLVEATYVSPAYCKECLKEFGERLVCYPKMIDVECSLNKQFITTDEYNHLGNYLKVYGILEDDTKVELSANDLDIRFEHNINVDLRYQIVLDYNGIQCTLDKVVLGLLEEIPLDFNHIDVFYDTLNPGLGVAYIGVYYDSLQEYFVKANCNTSSEYFALKGLKEPNITKRYYPFSEAEFLPISYYVKDKYCVFIAPDAYTDYNGRVYFKIYIYTMPDNFIELGLDKLLSDNIYELYYNTEKKGYYCIGEIDNPLLYIDNPSTTVHLHYFSQAEKEELIHRIEKFYGASYITYEREGYAAMYLYFSGNEQYEIVIEIVPTAKGYYDIAVSLIEKSII